MKASEIIREGKVRFFERGWGKETLLAPDTGFVCSLGALGLAAGIEEDRLLGQDALPNEEKVGALGEAIAWLVEACGQESLWQYMTLADRVVEFNDAEDRTFDEVVDAFDRAEKLAEQAESALLHEEEAK